MSKLSTSLEIHANTRTAPANICIYCGALDNLTDEHIVAYGLGGRLVLPSSSCPACNKITGAFEKQVLRGFMLDARTAGKFQTRRPKQRPASIAVEVERGEEFETVSIPSSQAVGILQLPILERSSFLTGEAPVKGIRIRGNETIGFGKSPSEVASALGTKGLRKTVTIEVHAFVRMLAKIGYSYAVSQLGSFPLSEVPVLSLILGTSDDGGTWVGSADYRLAIEEKRPQHALGLIVLESHIEEVLVAQVKLFANSGATGYEVVVRRKPLTNSNASLNRG